MSTWDDYPADYRAAEVQAIQNAVKAGECVAVVGLSGVGKSNLFGYLAHRPHSGDHPRYVLVDGNRLAEPSAGSFLRLMRQSLELAWPGPTAVTQESDALASLEVALSTRLAGGACFLLDLSLLLDRDGRLLDDHGQSLWGNLRALRDRHKYELVYVVATRHRLPPYNELAELFFGHTLWLGPLSEADARWNVTRYAQRAGQQWGADQVEAIMAASGGYPALLRGACEACAVGTPATPEALARHEAVAARVEEFWADRPEQAELAAAGLLSIELLMGTRPHNIDTAQLTAKEHRLLQVLEAHTGQVCDKDDLIRAVWSEDQVFESGVRDDSLAQLVRRLREKIEADAGRPRYIQTVPGRGYRFVKHAGSSA
jgi:energy-coupling factor transporter ATP-binding protein EcfA2